MSLTADYSPPRQDDFDKQIPEVLGSKKFKGMPLTFLPGLTPATPMEVFEVQNILESKMPMMYPSGRNSAMLMVSVETPDAQKVQKPKMSSMYPLGLTSAMLKDSLQIQDARKSIPSDYSCITTLMIGGIPSSFTEQDVFRFVVSAGLEDQCDFVYVPRLSNSGNYRYAFLNFTATIHAWTCAFFFNGLQLDPSHSTKTCSVSPAKIQGVANLKKHFRHSTKFWFRHSSLGSWVTQQMASKIMARNSETAAAVAA